MSKFARNTLLRKLQSTVESCNSCCATPEEAEHEEHDEHDEHDEHEENTSLDQSEIKLDSGLSVRDFKIILLFAMMISIAFGLLPKVCGTCKGGDNILSFLNCFSAGIFLGMAMIHIMPEA